MWILFFSHDYHSASCDYFSSCASVRFNNKSFHAPFCSFSSHSIAWMCLIDGIIPLCKQIFDNFEFKYSRKLSKNLSCKQETVLASEKKGRSLNCVEAVSNLFWSNWEIICVRMMSVFLTGQFISFAMSVCVCVCIYPFNKWQFQNYFPSGCGKMRTTQVYSVHRKYIKLTFTWKSFSRPGACFYGPQNGFCFDETASKWTRRREEKSQIDTLTLPSQIYWDEDFSNTV